MSTTTERRTQSLCQDCGKLKRHHARGLCGACYTRTRRQENPEVYRRINLRSLEKNREANRERCHRYYQRNRERLLSRQSQRDALRRGEKADYNRKYAQDHASELRSYQRGYKLEQKYSITKEEYDALVERQGGVCAICEGPQPWRNRSGKYVLAIDHDHETGKIRGLLCGPCNTALGHVERRKWLEKALAYLGLWSSPGT